MKIRPYQKKDKMDCLDIMYENIPDYFDEEESDDFRQFLENCLPSYYVIPNKAGKLVACGGIELLNQGYTAELRWVMVRNNYKRRGLGRCLMLYSLMNFLEKYDIKEVKIRTSQFAYKFFEKLGLQTEMVRTAQDHWADGLHLYLQKIYLDDTSYVKIQREFSRLYGNSLVVSNINALTT